MFLLIMCLDEHWYGVCPPCLAVPSLRVRVLRSSGKHTGQALGNLD